MNHTPIADTERKNDIIDHINEDHSQDVLNIALTHVSHHAQSAQIIDLFEEGILLRVDKQQPDHFIPFELHNADLSEQLHYTVFRATAEQGQPLSGNKRHYFNVLNNQRISPNIQRLTLQSDQALPDNEAGYAWYFQLKTHTRRENTAFDAAQQAEQKRLIAAARDSNSEERGRVFDSFFNDLRYYTLRRAEKSHANAPFLDTAIVDVYLHGDTSGSLWAKNLQTGDIIASNNDFHEHTDHLHNGQALLIGDETALPTVFSLLEQWTNPIAPIVISITDNPADQAYWQDCRLPEALKNQPIHHISQTADTAQAIIAILDKQPQIDSAWGAFEARQANQVRKYLTQRGITRGNNRVKGYWRQENAA